MCFTNYFYRDTAGELISCEFVVNWEVPGCSTRDLNMRVGGAVFELPGVPILLSKLSRWLPLDAGLNFMLSCGDSSVYCPENDA